MGLPPRGLILLLGLMSVHAAPAGGQQPRMASPPAWPADAFIDAGARDLVLRALSLRDSAAAGLLSYEATATERLHVGIAITRRMPLRARTLYHREAVARVRWRRDSTSTVRWIGRNEGTPTMGDAWSDNPPFGLDFNLAEELDLDDIGIDLLFDPLGDRMDVFGGEFTQPVSNRGLREYQFASGDTLRIALPAARRTITLVEVVVRPRARDWERVEGSLWFDRETGVLARAAFRPSDVWDWEVMEPQDADDVPGFLKPGIGTLESIVIEYGLFENRWWLPARAVAEGVMDWGDGLVRMPLTLEWSMAGHVLNEAPSLAASRDSNSVSMGYETDTVNGRRLRVEYFAPAGVDLSRAPELPRPLVEGGRSVFTAEELAPLVRRLEQVAGAPPQRRSPALTRTLLASLRYDRVRGLSAGYARTHPLGSFQLTGSLRLATAVPDLYGHAGIARGRATLALYRTLADASDWNHADGLGNSAATLLFGQDGGDYYRTQGASLAWNAGRPAAHVALVAFAERQRSIERQTNLSVATIGGGRLRTNLSANAVDVVGLGTGVGGQFGDDVQKALLSWRLRTEVATTRDSAFARVLGGLRLTGPLGGRYAGAIDLSAGTTTDLAPPQRQFLLGGAGTLRGARENAIAGPAFWLARTELAAGLPGLRLTAFLDAGWAGERDAIRSGSPAAGTGVGVSLMDGLFRMDLARGVLRADRWRLYFYLDALL